MEKELKTTNECQISNQGRGLCEQIRESIDDLNLKDHEYVDVNSVKNHKRLEELSK